jgi:hypothetical protein
MAIGLNRETRLKCTYKVITFQVHIKVEIRVVKCYDKKKRWI